MGNRRLRIGVDLPTLEVRIRNNGRIFSRQYIDLSPEQARRRAQKLGKVICIRKVPLWDIMGSVETRKSLQGIIGQAAPMGDVMLEGKSLEEILFPKKRREERRNREKERRERTEGLTETQGE